MEVESIQIVEKLQMTNQTNNALQKLKKKKSSVIVEWAIKQNKKQTIDVTFSSANDL